MGSAQATVMPAAATVTSGSGGSSTSSTGGGSTTSSGGGGGGPMDPLTLLASALVVGLVAKRRQAGCENRHV
jgi:hypothetical protein